MKSSRIFSLQGLAPAAYAARHEPELNAPLCGRSLMSKKFTWVQTFQGRAAQRIK
jgi:hypothetical protein